MDRPEYGNKMEIITLDKVNTHYNKKTGIITFTLYYSNEFIDYEHKKVDKI